MSGPQDLRQSHDPHWPTRAPRTASVLKPMVVAEGAGLLAILVAPSRGIRMNPDHSLTIPSCGSACTRRRFRVGGLGAHDSRTVSDVGVGGGYHTVYFIRRPEAKKIFSFEPDANATSQPMHNLELNGLGDDPAPQSFALEVGTVANGVSVTLD